MVDRSSSLGGVLGVCRKTCNWRRKESTCLGVLKKRNRIEWKNWIIPRVVIPPKLPHCCPALTEGRQFCEWGPPKLRNRGRFRLSTKPPSQTSNIYCGHDLKTFLGRFRWLRYRPHLHDAWNDWWYCYLLHLVIADRTLVGCWRLMSGCRTCPQGNFQLRKIFTKAALEPLRIVKGSGKYRIFTRSSRLHIVIPSCGCKAMILWS